MSFDPSPYLVPGFPEVLDSSMLATYKQCPQLFKKIYIDQWKAREPSVHLHAGAAFAKGIETARNCFYVENLSSEDSVAAGLSALMTAYGSFECPADSAKSLIRTAGALEFYFDQYPLSHDNHQPILLPSGKRGIEFSFTEPLEVDHPETGNPILYCGRMDAILDFAGGNFICDEKTATSLGPTWSRQWDLRAQFTGYAWGCARAGIKITGAIVRGISILKTKYDTQQAITYRPQWMIDRWYNEVHEWIAEMIFAYKRNSWKYIQDHACADFGGCAFRQACSSQDEAPYLETYFVRKHWDPVTRKETLL